MDTVRIIFHCSIILFFSCIYQKFWSLSERISDNEHVVKGLQESKEYEFRVAAVNKVGKGKWTQTEAPIEAREPDCINYKIIFSFKIIIFRVYI